MENQSGSAPPGIGTVRETLLRQFLGSKKQLRRVVVLHLSSLWGIGE